MTPRAIPFSERRRKRRALGSRLREAWLRWKYRAARFDLAFDYDWAAIPHDRIELVNHLLALRPGADYLEIGCAGDELFAAVQAGSKTGVDPARGGTHRMTSDAFFAANPEARFDVIFIDGLHRYDQVRRDLVHALRAVKAGGWIAMHDMLPCDWIDEHLPQISTAAWTGDCWKCAFELLDTAGVEFRVVEIDHGVVVVRVVSAGVELADYRAELSSAGFRRLFDNVNRLPLASWDEALAWLGSVSD